MLSAPPSSRSVDDGGMVTVRPPDTTKEPEPETGMPGEGIVGNCGVDTNKIFELAQSDATPRTLPLGINPIASRAAFAFVGEASGCNEALYVSDIEGDASNLMEPDAELVVGCALYGDPAVAWAAQDAWLLAFVDNRVGNEVWAQVHDPAGDLTNEGFQLSTDATKPDHVGVAVVGDDRRIVVWSESPVAGGDTTVYARAVDATGEPQAARQIVASFTGALGYMTISQLGKPGEGLPDPGAVVAMWRVGATSEIVVIPLDLTGKPSGGERVVRGDVGEKANVALTLNTKHEFGADFAAAGLAYTVSQSGGQQLYFEMLDNDAQIGPLWDNTGTLRGPSKPQRLVNSPNRATGVSVTRYPQGYVVAYRALPGGTLDVPHIRVIFLNRTGEFIVDSDVAITTEFGGPTAITTGTDGRIVIAWSDIDEAGTATYYVARLPCP